MELISNKVSQPAGGQVQVQTHNENVLMEEALKAQELQLRRICYPFPSSGFSCPSSSLTTALGRLFKVSYFDWNKHRPREFKDLPKVLGKAKSRPGKDSNLSRSHQICDLASAHALS